MLKTWIAPAAAALGVLLLVGSVDTAEAGRRGGWSGGGGAKFYGARMHSGPKVSGGAKWQGAPRIYAGPKHSGGYKYSGGYKKHGGKHKFGRHHKYRFVGVPLAYYGYSNYAYLDNSCYWLRHRALDTGNSYWWDRYYACLDGYDAY
jgi:hypothetical protein